MEKKVLVIDDSALMRRVISDIINEDEQLSVADTAANGQDAIDLLLNGKHCDIILVDINMPKMNGVQFLKEMHKNRISIPTIMVSSIAGENANETLEALELGAFDFVKKPAGTVGKALADFKEDILLRIYCGCGLTVHHHHIELKKDDKKEVKKAENHVLEKAQPRPEKTVQRKLLGGGNKLVVIASSTGGPKALQSVIPYFPENFPYPIVVVQHMPQGFTASLAHRLDEMSPLTVKEAEDGERLKKGYVYIAQGGKQCELLQKETGTYQIWENDKPARGGLRPCADIFLESLVTTSFDEIVCGVLTGMGADASQGILKLRKLKNIKVVAQNEATCVVYGMPRAVKAAGVVDEMVPLEDVAGTIMKKIGV